MEFRMISYSDGITGDIILIPALGNIDTLFFLPLKFTARKFITILSKRNVTLKRNSLIHFLENGTTCSCGKIAKGNKIMSC